MNGDVEQQPQTHPSEPFMEVEFVPDVGGLPTPENTNAVFGLSPVWNLTADIEWLIADVIPLSAVTLLTAEAGTGKTWVAQAIAGAVAHGRRFLGREVKQRPVLYLDGENPLALVLQRLGQLSIDPTEALSIWGGWHSSEPPGPKDERLLNFAREYQPLIIFDSLVYFHQGDEQSATETRAFMNFFRKLANAGATLVVLHHTGKGKSSKRYRGSSDIEASVDMAYHLEGTRKAGPVDRLRMTCFKSRFQPGQNFGLEFHQGRGFEDVALPQGTQKASAETVVPGIIADHPDGINGMKTKALAKEQGVGKNAVDEFLRTWPNWKAGTGKEKLYLPREAVPAEEVRAA
ncbi:MAG: AAA family ATPase [Acidobacteriia bacterium]|nr:AAA family ATPase [Terriglobia bacterium]